jgi:N-glycosylase/DNA lyase
MYIYIYVYMYIYRKEIYLTVEVPLPTDKRVPDLQLALNYIPSPDRVVRKPHFVSSYI